MSDFYMGQIMMTGFGYAQKNFAACNGGTVAVAQNQALFSLLGVTYGGDGIRTFGLPDLRGRNPAGAVISQDTKWQPTPYTAGMISGVETVSLLAAQNAPHMHAMTATSDPGIDAVQSGSEVLAQATSPGMLYGAAAALIPLAGGPTSTAGAGAAHDNMQPFEVINFNIAMYGIYPSRS